MTEQFETAGWEVFAQMRADLMKRSDVAYTVFNRIVEALDFSGEVSRLDAYLKAYEPAEFEEFEW